MLWIVFILSCKADEFERLREELDKIDPLLLKKEVVSHWYYDPDDQKVLYQINREYFTLVVYLENMSENERQKLDAFLNKLD